MSVSLNLGSDIVETSTRRELFPLPETGSAAHYGVSPDAKRFLVFALAEQNTQPLNVIVNWPALLKKGAASQ